jgi:hypothetical protein
VEKKLLAVSICACLLGACATTNDKAASDQPRDAGAYVTGSRLPHKTTGSAPVSQTSKEDWENQNRGQVERRGN